MKSGVITKQALSTQAKLVNIISSSLFVLDFEDNKTNVTVLSLNSEGLKINLPEKWWRGKNICLSFLSEIPRQTDKMMPREICPATNEDWQHKKTIRQLQHQQ